MSCTCFSRRLRLWTAGTHHRDWISNFKKWQRCISYSDAFLRKAETISAKRDVCDDESVDKPQQTSRSLKKFAKLELAKNSKPTAVEKEVIDYLYQHGKVSETMSPQQSIRNVFKQFIKPTKIVPTSTYLINKSAAVEFAKFIKNESPDVDCPVVELNPGLGLLTTELLYSVGLKYVTGFEDISELGKIISSRFKIPVIDSAFNDIPRHHHLDKHDGGERVHSLLQQIHTGSENLSTTDRKNKDLYIIGAFPCISAMNFLLRSYATSRIFYEDDLPWSRVTLFIALGSKIHAILNATPDSGFVAYRTATILFQTMFTCKEIGVLPRKAFIPWEISETHLNKIKRSLKANDSATCKVVRVEINKEIQDKIGKENMLNYWYFVRHHFYARTNRIIPELERWIPGCGVKLIKQGFTIYSKFGDLKPQQVVELYLEFVSWPEFANCSFLSAVEKFHTRMEISEEHVE